MKRVLKRALWAALFAVGAGAVPAYAVVVPSQKPLSEKSFRQPDLFVPEIIQTVGSLPSLAAGLREELAELGVAPDQGFFDTRTGRWSSLILSEPLIPGTGVGNNLRWIDLAGSNSIGDDVIRDETWKALQAFLHLHQAQLRVDLSELGSPRIGVAEGGNIVQLYVPRVVGGVPVRDSGLTAFVNHGNLILLGLQNWGDIDIVPAVAISSEHARGIATGHASPFNVSRYLRGQQLELVPSLREGRIELRLAWALSMNISGDLGTWEALVDATNGDLLAFEDKNQYAQRRIVGGVFPVSNDGRPGDGQEQPGWPMPFADITIGGNTTFSTTGGTFGCATGNATSALSGQFVRMADVCGAVNETSAGDFDLGVSAGTDCVVPPGHSVGDTHSSRSGFYELNRLIEQGRGYLPTNTWLQSQLTSNMNIVSSCNAFWNGSTVNFYRDSANCRNTGEIAGIFDHEWGHGLDNFGVNNTISNPGEGIADIRAGLRLNTSCLGRGFWKNQTCGGYGDPCSGNPTNGCTGIRDADWALHVSGVPHDIPWTRANCGSGPAPCGGGVHCGGQVVGESAWDLHFRDLRAPPFSLDANTALELTTRLFYLGAETVTSWYTCAAGCETAGTCGCGTTGGYLLMLGADDDDGNLANGTPHMGAIFAAFDRHDLACNAPAPINFGCAGGPTAAPTVTATPVDSGVNLTWTAVPNATRYAVYRTEGIAACAFGKVKVGETIGTGFTDRNLLNGRPYSYVVLPVGSNTACFGRTSACVTSTPVAGPNLSIRPTVTLNLTGGDGDEFVDNCENATINFTVENIGTGTLTNVRLTAVTPLSHPTTVVNTPLPLSVSASMADCAIASAGVSVTPQGMTFGQNTQLLLTVTADQIAPATRTQLVTITNVESDWINNPTRTFNFDTDFDTWVVQQGTWTRAAGGAAGTPFHLSSSENQPFQCDIIRSPLVRLSATSTLTLQNNFDIEPTDAVGGPYDRANVNVIDQLLNTRTVISPSSGTLYTVPTAPTPDFNECGQSGQAGWNAISPGYPNFAASNWTSAALNPGGVFTGRRAFLEIRYGTDPLLHPEGFDFDQATLTAFDTLGPDVQGNNCVAQAVEPLALAVDDSGNGVFQPGEAASVQPTWRNVGFQPITLTGALSNFTGPAGPTYTIGDGSASYGTIAVSANAQCTDCYSLSITAPTRPVQHWDTTVLETVTPTATTKTWTLHVGDSFTDVPASNLFFEFIETIFHRGITGGCGAGIYCPTNSTSREQMAVFVLVAKEGAGYNPPACVPPNLFADVPETSGFCPWIEELANRQVVSGCGGGNYCPTQAVTRDTMAVFVLRTLDPALDPPACVQGSELFDDVPFDNPFCEWIEELARRGVIGGCGGGNYCPLNPVTREQMGVFLTETFSLTLYGL